MEIAKSNIYVDKDWKDFLLLKYNLFFDPNFLVYNDIFEKHRNWYHLKAKAADKNRIDALITGCVEEINGDKTFVSCSGASFGGFNWMDKFDLINYSEGIKSFKTFLQKNSFKRCILRNQPDIYEINYDQEFEYALLKEGFTNTNYSITNIVQLNLFEYSKLANPLKRTIRNCEKQIQFIELKGNMDQKYWNDFYSVLEKNRALKNTKPTHTLDELKYLKSNLKEKIQLFSVEIDSVIIGICVLFIVRPDVTLNFYLATDDKYKKYRAADFLLYKSIEWSKHNGFRLYDIGTSDANGNLIEGLFNFKKKFLANGFFRKSFSINL